MLGISLALDDDDDDGDGGGFEPAGKARLARIPKGKGGDCSSLLLVPLDGGTSQAKH